METLDSMSFFDIFSYLEAYLWVFWSSESILKTITHTEVVIHTWTLSHILSLFFFFFFLKLILCYAAMNSFTDGPFLFLQYQGIIIIAIR